MTRRNTGIAMLVCFVLGVLLGFVPEYLAKSHVEDKMAAITASGQETQAHLHHTERQLRLNEFALRAAVVSADASANNYADASQEASALFTDLRSYVDTSGDAASKQQILDVLATRDTTISGLAKADASVKSSLSQMFETLRAVSSKTNG